MNYLLFPMIDIETYDCRIRLVRRICNVIKKDFGDKFENLYGIHGYILKEERKEFRGA